MEIYLKDRDITLEFPDSMDISLIKQKIDSQFYPEKLQNQETKTPHGASGNWGGEPSYLENFQQTPQRIWDSYKESAKNMESAITQGSELIQKPGLLNKARGITVAGLGTAGNMVNAVFVPMTETIKGIIPQTKSQFLNSITTGAGMGSALGGASGGIIGGLIGAGFATKEAIQNKLLEDPKIKSFIDQNPDVTLDIDNAINVGLSALGSKGKLGQKPKDVLNMPISEAPQVITQNIINTGISTARTTAKTIKGITKIANILAKYGTSQSTGLSPDSVSRIISNPQDFSPSKMKEFTPEGIANEAINKINSRLDNLSEIGKEYKSIRESKQPVKIPNETIKDVFKKYNINIDNEGKLVFDKESIPTIPGDRTALQNWYDTYGKDTQHTSNSILNARKGLDNLAQWDSTKTDATNVLAMDLRQKLNEVARPQIKGLENLDSRFAPEISELKQIKKDYFNSDGTLKDNAISKIANLSNKGREPILNRLEQISPGISEKIRTIKAVKDIQVSSGQKVGTYVRSGIFIGGIATGNISAIVTAILSEPHIATQILRGWGKIVGAKNSVVNKVLDTYNNNFGLIEPNNPPPSKTSGTPIQLNYPKPKPKTLVSQIADEIVKINQKKLKEEQFKNTPTGNIQKTQESPILEQNIKKPSITTPEVKTKNKPIPQKEINQEKQPYEMTKDEWIKRQKYLAFEDLTLKQQEIAKNNFQKETGDMDIEEKNWTNYAYDIKTLKVMTDDNPSHKFEIQQAISKGKSIPPEILKDYPDLIKSVIEKQGGEFVGFQKDKEGKVRWVIFDDSIGSTKSLKMADITPENIKMKLEENGKIETKKQNYKEITKEK